MQISLDSCLVAARGVIGQVVKDEVVLILPERSEVKVLNEVGAHVWLHLDGSHTLRQIAAAVCNDYDAELGHVEQDVLNFARELLQRGLVSIAAPQQNSG